MEIQISPVNAFKQNNDCESSSKRFKSNLTFHCIVCNDSYNDPNGLYDHMKMRHPELYEHDNGQNNDEIYDLDVDVDDRCEKNDSHGTFDFHCEISDDEYLDLSHLLEPICELRHDGDDDIESAKNVPTVPHHNDFNSNDDQLRYQLKLQLQLENHMKEENKLSRPFALRKLKNKKKVNISQLDNNNN